MISLQLSEISLAFGDRDILRDVTLTLDGYSRTALTGANGSGKSTLMKIICGDITPDGGRVIASRGMRIGYLPQSGLLYKGRNLIDEAETAFERHLVQIHRKEELEELLASSDESDPGLKTILEEHHAIVEELIREDYDRRFEAIERVLIGLGFSRDQFDAPCETFSGGWQMRIALAKVLLGRPHIVLLDEPTNYLDLEARGWLEQFLKDYPGGVLLVSHDRYFLDATVKEVVEVFDGSLKRYRGNYSEYETVRKEELVSLMAAWEKQQEEIAKLEEFIARFRYNASKAKLVQSRVKQLEKINRITIPETLKKIHFSFPPPPHSGKEMLRIGGLNKGYGEHLVVKQLDLLLLRGEKVVIAGPNGAGKSTLLRILAGIDHHYEGSVEYGTDVSIGYFAQDREEFAGSTATVIEEMEASAPSPIIPQLRNLLGAFLFRGDDIYKRIEVLSGGEKSRLSLMKLLLQPHNLLILDEPTNHLDLHSKDVLLDALRQYEGTVIFVSHDRGFIEHLATRVIELSAGERARNFPGDYEYYLWRKEQETADGETAAQHDDSPPFSKQEEEIPREGKLSWEEEKRIKNMVKELRREEERLLSEIERLESKAGELKSRLERPEVYSDPVSVRDVQALIEKNDRELQLFSQKWEETAETLSVYEP
ncbi:ABC-F family ATP-binding cassette domain-containing protein [Sediminispirochaeta smaragdinae]|uniref:ABC transporter related protein n=1 Tax=Sediminispirochaeta smaragdinae (strain DSM 11293 / JCM 15392 / SEBR 4228) TaxID=573413 RepID=E1R279_SEDSS|nr:ABC-F family ATP-binding cassette domain-containing protein [Sediminispirochaeta smaragdinae]ADK81964.1 ABC transporter related protein [Sediminispirochaeta smaragdinae DSM 11293]